MCLMSLSLLSLSSTSLSLDSLLWVLLAASFTLLLVGSFAGNYEEFLDVLERLKEKPLKLMNSEIGFSSSWLWQNLSLSRFHLKANLPIKVMATIYLLISVVGFFVSRKTPAIYQDWNVDVEMVVDDGYIFNGSPLSHTWLLNSKGDVNHRPRGEYQDVFCDTPHNNLVLHDTNGQAGYNLDHIFWEVTGRGCINVSDETPLTGPLGFWWHKEHGQVVKIAKEGS